MSSGIWIVLVSIVLLGATAIGVDLLSHRLPKRCPYCGRIRNEVVGWQLIPGTLKRRLHGGGKNSPPVPHIDAKHNVTYKCLACGYKWTKVKSVSQVSL